MAACCSQKCRASIVWTLSGYKLGRLSGGNVNAACSVVDSTTCIVKYRKQLETECYYFQLGSLVVMLWPMRSYFITLFARDWLDM
jgi:hypothetical protein